MRVIIDATGKNDPDLHYMSVDDHGLLVDLDHVRFSIVDPGTLTGPDVARVEWEGNSGRIIRPDGTVQRFFDRNLLRPYLALYAAKKAEALGAK